MIRTIIIDDEKTARDVLTGYLEKYCNDIEVVAMADSGRAALQLIQQYQPDLIFLDVEMPGGDAFALLKSLPQINFHTIFVTAHPEYAVNAFRFNAVDYLIKPLSIDELLEAVERVREMMKGKPDLTGLMNLLKNPWKEGELPDRLVIQDRQGSHVLNIRDIIYCESDAYATLFYLSDQRRFCSTRNLKHFENLLDKHSFLRIHNEFMINLHYLDSYSSQDETVYLVNRQNLPLGNTYKKRFKLVLEKMLQ